MMYPVLFQVDNKGNRLLVHEESSINVPAIAAAHVIKRYIAQAADELSFEVNVLTACLFKSSEVWNENLSNDMIALIPL